MSLSSGAANMKKRFICITTAALFAAACVFSQTKSSFVGTWKLDTAQSKMAEPMKSLTVVILKDTPQMLSWRGNGVDDKGQPFSLLWKGPEDGSIHPTIRNGKADFNQRARKEQDGTIVRQGGDKDGSWEARSKVSADGKTLTDEITSKSKDGKETKEVDVYQRVPSQKKPSA
jgi:poly(3-hydroxybutyrate) depolymerase